MTVKNNEASRKIHVVFLHNMLRKRSKDRYMLDMAMAMKVAGHRVSIYTSDFEQQNCFDEVDIWSGCINVFYSGWWLPKKFKLLRSILMALRMIFFPPNPKPSLIVLDINPVALYLFAMLSCYKTIYLAHLSGLQEVENYTKLTKIIPDFLSAKTLKYADEVVVKSEGLSDILRASFPNVHKEIKILHPCVDTGMWRDAAVDVVTIVPDVPKPYFLFVCFGCYRKRSNFELVLTAFGDLLLIAAANIRNNLQLVIAGQCRNLQENVYYEELLHNTTEKSCASQVTFLKNIPIVYRKSLIEKSVGVIVPCKHEVFPDTILPVLSAGRPIIATKTGFAKVALRHHITAILVEPAPQVFAAAMLKLLMDQPTQLLLSEKGHDVFVKRYSNKAFRKKVNGIVLNYSKNQ